MSWFRICGKYDGPKFARESNKAVEGALAGGKITRIDK
jgi:hypothetical protein